MNQKKRLYVVLYTKETSYPVYDDVVDVNTLQSTIAQVMYDAPEMALVFGDRIQGFVDAREGGFYILGVFVPASVIYRALSDTDEAEADEIFDAYTEMMSYNITQKLKETGRCSVENVRYYVDFRLMEVDE